LINFRVMRKLRLFILLFLLVLPSAVRAQSDRILTVSGIVRDDSQRLPFVSVTIKGSTLGTITNEDGYFSLKIPATEKDITLVISHVGYYANELSVKAADAHELRIFLKPYPNMLDPALVVSMDPETLVREAIRHISRNYPVKPVSQRGFYRETIRKGNRFIGISEAVVDGYKTGYFKSTDFDRIEILKGRRLVSQKNADTLAVKMQGGPVLAMALDVVKNDGDLFFEEDLKLYDYSMETPTVIEQKPVFVVRMTPRENDKPYPLYNALVFIDKENLAIMRAEYSVDMSDRAKVDKAILLKKPKGLKFASQEVSFISSYRYVEGKAVQHYVRCGISFKCDWKTRLFSSAYNVVTEMVDTDIRFKDVETIPVSDAFKRFDTFYDKVEGFYDPDFWGDYNILEPSESLEHAVDRLKRKLR